MKVLKKLCLPLCILPVVLLSGCSQNVTDKQITATIGKEQYTGFYTGVVKFDKAEGEGTLTVKDNKTGWSYKGT